MSFYYYKNGYRKKYLKFFSTKLNFIATQIVDFIFTPFCLVVIEKRADACSLKAKISLGFISLCHILIIGYQ